MSETFIQDSTVCFLPIVRYRLAFAVAVRRAFEAIQWDEPSAVAVGLPRSVVREIEEVLDRQPCNPTPEIRLILCSSGESYREVFAFTPCDGMCEAIRIAKEKRIPIIALDTEIIPGNLADRKCLPSEEWPDDALIFEAGIPRYMRWVERLVGTPPARFEPIDTLREATMADSLQKQFPFFRTILVVCDAVNYRAIHTQLNQVRSATFSRTEVKRVMANVKRASLNPTALMRYLDDYPKLVERFARDDSVDFNKTRELFLLVYDILREIKDLPISLGRFQRFVDYCLRLTRSIGRDCPKTDQLYSACSSFFGKPAADRVARNLVSYGEQIVVARIGTIIPSGASVFGLINKGRSDDRFVTRTCDLIGSSWRVSTIPRNKKRNDIVQIYWPECYEFEFQMRSKAINVMRSEAQRLRLERFCGVLERGIDARTTVRKRLSFAYARSNAPRHPAEGIYVKARQQVCRPLDYTREPIVWVFPAYVEEEQTFGLWAHQHAGFEKEKVLVCSYGSTLQELSRSALIEPYTEDDLLGFERYSAVACFYDGRSSEIEIKNSYGEDWRVHIPNHDSDFVHDGGQGCIHKELVRDLGTGARGWEIILLTALKYAREGVLCFVPAGFRESPLLRSHPFRTGKALVLRSINAFSNGEQWKLASRYGMATNRYRTKREVYTLFKPIMRQFWEPLS